MFGKQPKVTKEVVAERKATANQLMGNLKRENPNNVEASQNMEGGVLQNLAD